MPKSTKVTVRDFYERGKDSLSMELLTDEKDLTRPIVEPAICRPGLALTGFFKYFPHRRIQLIGYAELSYMLSLDKTTREERVRALLEANIPCVVFARSKTPPEWFMAIAKNHSVPILRTKMVTGVFTNAATLLMEELSAPRIRAHGTMVEIAGMGILIEGEPGIGKSETALGLIKRGNALVSDDCTIIRPDGSGALMGSAPETTRSYMEIRGLGIIHVPSIFGASAVRGEKQLNLVISLVRQNETDEIDRIGEQDLRRDFLGIQVPQVVIPVAPGRDLVNIVETVAMEYNLRFSGELAFKTLGEKLKLHHIAIQKK